MVGTTNIDSGSMEGYASFMAIVIDSKTKLTYEDYALLPDDGKIHEIIDGEHYMTPAPATYHQTLSRRIQFQPRISDKGDNW